MSGMEFHPLADLFPMLEAGAADELAADIRANGLHQAIVTFEGKILDGRNRYLACLAAGVEPRFKEFAGDDPLGYVVSLNLTRRHLDASQRASIAAKIATLGHGGDRSSGKFAACPTQAAAAALMNVSERSVRNARVVLEKGSPEFISAVEQGKMAVSSAANSLRPHARPADKYIARQEAKLGPLNAEQAIGEGLTFCDGVAGAISAGTETQLIQKKLAGLSEDLRTDLTGVRSGQISNLARLRFHAGIDAIKNSLKRTAALINDALGTPGAGMDVSPK
jgi:hypothetical protein